MSTAEQIKKIGRDAINQLAVEADKFEQLASEYSVCFEESGKTDNLNRLAEHLKKVAGLIEQKIEHEPGKIMISVKIAADLLKKSRHSKLKLRIELLQKEIAVLELEAEQWPPLHDEFMSMADNCREACATYLAVLQKEAVPDAGADTEGKALALDIERKDLINHVERLHNEIIKLREKQDKELRVDRAAVLRQKLYQLNDETEVLSEMIQSHPELSKNCQDICTLCRDIESELWKRVNQGTVDELEKAIDTAERLIEQVKDGQTSSMQQDKATVIPTTKDYISIDEKMMEEQMSEILSPTSPFDKTLEFKARKNKRSTRSRKERILRNRGKNSALVVGAYFISMVGLVLFFLLNIRNFM